MPVDFRQLSGGIWVELDTYTVLHILPFISIKFRNFFFNADRAPHLE